jgi:hypothetical protein
MSIIGGWLVSCSEPVPKPVAQPREETIVIVEEVDESDITNEDFNRDGTPQQKEEEAPLNLVGRVEQVCQQVAESPLPDEVRAEAERICPQGQPHKDLNVILSSSFIGKDEPMVHLRSATEDSEENISEFVRMTSSQFAMPADKFFDEYFMDLAFFDSSTRYQNIVYDVSYAIDPATSEPQGAAIAALSGGVDTGVQFLSGLFRVSNNRAQVNAYQFGEGVYGMGEAWQPMATTENEEYLLNRNFMLIFDFEGNTYLLSLSHSEVLNRGNHQFSLELGQEVLAHRSKLFYTRFLSRAQAN